MTLLPLLKRNDSVSFKYQLFAFNIQKPILEFKKFVKGLQISAKIVMVNDDDQLYAKLYANLLHVSRITEEDCYYRNIWKHGFVLDLSFMIHKLR